jgi:bifunctional ADP-heptose synthase (sugar kinase/adenylyltransferase)
LENDKSVQKLKGKKRPINNQQERAEVLTSIKYVDYVVKLGDMNSNQDYDNLIYKINPNIIAVTKQDKQIIHKKRQAKKIGARIIEVMPKIKYKSTTNLAKLIEKDF